MTVATPIQKLLNTLEWKQLEGDAPESNLPHATHEGVLEILGHKLRCYRLSDGQTVFHAEDFQSFFGLSSREVPFDDDAVCDSCGAKGAYDFIGDLLCQKCAEASVPSEGGR